MAQDCGECQLIIWLLSSQQEPEHPQWIGRWHLRTNLNMVAKTKITVPSRMKPMLSVVQSVAILTYPGSTCGRLGCDTCVVYLQVPEVSFSTLNIWDVDPPAAAVPIMGCPARATATSHIPSLWPEYSRTREQLTVGPLKLDTILLVWAFSLCAVLIFWDPDPVTAE